MSDLVATTRGRVADLLAALGVPAELGADGTFAVPHGPTTVFVVVSEAGGRGVLDLWAPVLPEVALTPELFRYAAETSFLFGRLCVARTGDAAGQLQLCHAMLTDPIDEEILLACLGPLANTAADLALALPERFGAPGATAG